MNDRRVLAGLGAEGESVGDAWPSRDEVSPRGNYRDQAQRDYFPRAIGTGLGALAVGSVLYESDAAAGWWVLLVANGFVWPHLAFLLARRSGDADRFEFGNLLVDSVLAGVWVAAMQFNLLVSAVVVTLVWMDNMAVGAERLFLKGLVATGLGILVGGAIAGFGWRPEPSLLSAVCSLPVLLSYPLLVGLWTNRMFQRLNEKRRALEKLSQLDGLSGVNNRQYWEFLARAEFNRATRQDLKASLILLDIDRFKEFNDRHGHVAGDETIRAVGRILRNCVRREDAIGRYGGEEFAIVLTGATEEEALAKAEAIRAAVNRQHGNGQAVTVSCGVAELEPEIGDFMTWIEHADQALYRAKDLGRDRSEPYRY